jgi:hypothetical protein
MARTRSTKTKTTTNAATPNATTIQAAAAEESEPKTLSPPDNNPPKLFVLPRNVSRDARIITLPDPARNQPTRYLFCPDRGFFEFLRIAAPRAEPRSWLLVSQETEEDDASAGAQERDANQKSNKFSKQSSSGYVSQSQDLFVATPYDPIFLLIPILWPATASAKISRKAMFLTLDDHIDSSPDTSKHFEHCLRHATCRQRILDRLRMVCETVDAGDESMFRLSQDKLARYILSKATRLVAKGLPPSLEERFVSRVLHVPNMVVAAAAEAAAAVAETKETVTTEPESSEESTQPSADASTAAPSAISSATSTFASSADAQVTTSSAGAPDTMTQLLRTRTALSFILRSYVRPDLHSTILSAIASAQLVDFSALDVHLAQLEADHASLKALRSISDNISRKRGADDEEVVAERAEKKRRKEEEERKKKSETRGVKDLRKVNTKGMMKLSAFFGKKEAKT